MKDEQKKSKAQDYAERHPEYVPPKYGEKVQSFAVRDENGKKRITYVYDEKYGYPYEGEDQRRSK